MTTNHLGKYIDMKSAQGQNMILAPCGHLGIPRSEMPQIHDEHRDAFIDFMKERGISVTPRTVPIGSLRMVQSEYDRAKVHSIIKSGDKNRQPIFISKNNFVVDGNHRMLAKLNNGSKTMKVIELGMDVKELLPIIGEFDKVKHQSLHGKSV